jgi:hypothetical protein
MSPSSSQDFYGTPKFHCRFQVMWDLWWIKWCWDGFSPNTAILSVLIPQIAPHLIIRNCLVSILKASLNNHLKSPPLVPVMSELNPVQILMPNFFRSIIC